MNQQSEEIQDPIMNHGQKENHIPQMNHIVEETQIM